MGHFSFEPFSGSPRVAVDHRRRVRTRPRSSRRDALCNDTLRYPRRLRRSLHRRPRDPPSTAAHDPMAVRAPCVSMDTFFLKPLRCC